MKPIPYDKFTLISNKPPEQLKSEIISGLNEAAQREFKRLDPISKRIISSNSGENGLDDFYIFTYEDRVLLVTPDDEAD